MQKDRAPLRTKLILSVRLQAVADMVTAGNVVCDIGCDHGFVSIYLALKGISPRVIAMDVNRGPLQAAGEHVKEYGLTGYIETRLSDGVGALAAGEADTLICAGMGGRLMVRILEEGKEKIRAMQEVILQPQSEIQMVRRYLREEGYRIADEDMILEEGKYYPVIKALPDRMDARHLEDICRVEDKYGPVLLAKRNPVLESYLRREDALCLRIMETLRTNGNGKEKRLEELEARRKDIGMALSYYVR